MSSKTNDQIADFIGKVCDNKLEPEIEKWFAELSDYSNAFKNAMVMKREVIANKGIWVAKKRYMLNVLDEEGIRLSEPKLKLMGIELLNHLHHRFVELKLKRQSKLLCQKKKLIYIS